MYVNSSSAGISSFKSKMLQLRWQWEMDLIAGEQFVSSLQNTLGDFLLISQSLGVCGGRDMEKLENTSVNKVFR